MQRTTTLNMALEAALQDQIRSDRRFGTPDLCECSVGNGEAIFNDLVDWSYFLPHEETRLIAIASMINELLEEAQAIAKAAESDTARFDCE